MAETPEGGAAVLRSCKPALLNALSADADYVLQHADSLDLLSRGEYRRIKALTDPSEKIRDILDCVIQKGRGPAETFLGFLKKADTKKTFPKLSVILKRVELPQEAQDQRNSKRKRQEEVEISSKKQKGKADQRNSKRKRQEEVKISSKKQKGKADQWNSKRKRQEEVEISSKKQKGKADQRNSTRKRQAEVKISSKKQKGKAAVRLRKQRMEDPVFRRDSSGSLELKPSPEALRLSAPGPSGGKAQYRAKSPEEVEEQARASIRSKGGDPGNAKLILSHSTIQFGKYRGQTFRWLLENDVGYAIHLVFSHWKERKTPQSQGAQKANKDALTRYACAYRDFAKLFRFRKAQDKAQSLASQPGQEGAALVGFHKYKEDTLKDLYESKDGNRIDYVKWLRTKTAGPGTKMDTAIRYIRRRDQEREQAVS